MACSLADLVFRATCRLPRRARSRTLLRRRRASGARSPTPSWLASPPTWRSAAANNLAIFVAVSPVLLSGLSSSGFAAAYLLGTRTWRELGPQLFLLLAAYFVGGTAATKLRIKQNEASGVAEKRGGSREPGSVIDSSAAGCVCAILSIYNNVDGAALAELWSFGFAANFCTKLSDTVSSEIGKAYGRTTVGTCRGLAILYQDDHRNPAPTDHTLARTTHAVPTFVHPGPEQASSGVLDKATWH